MKQNLEECKIKKINLKRMNKLTNKNYKIKKNNYFCNNNSLSTTLVNLKIRYFSNKKKALSSF